jgi:hypothetical protein
MILLLIIDAFVMYRSCSPLQCFPIGIHAALCTTRKSCALLPHCIRELFLPKQWNLLNDLKQIKLEVEEKVEGKNSESFSFECEGKKECKYNDAFPEERKGETMNRQKVAGSNLPHDDDLASAADAECPFETMCIHCGLLPSLCVLSSSCSAQHHLDVLGDAVMCRDCGIRCIECCELLKVDSCFLGYCFICVFVL